MIGSEKFRNIPSLLPPVLFVVIRPQAAAAAAAATFQATLLHQQRDAQ
jgi:hypothetical protein